MDRARQSFARRHRGIPSWPRHRTACPREHRGPSSFLGTSLGRGDDRAARIRDNRKLAAVGTLEASLKDRWAALEPRSGAERSRPTVFSAFLDASLAPMVGWGEASERPWPCEMGIVGYLSDGSDGVPSFEPGTWHVQRPTSREAPPTGWLRSFDGTNHESKRFCRRTTRPGRARRPGSERRARVMPSTACAARRSPPFLHIGRFQGTSGPFGSATSMPKEMPASSGTDRFLGRWAVTNER